MASDVAGYDSHSLRSGARHSPHRHRRHSHTKDEEKNARPKDRLMHAAHQKKRLSTPCVGAPIRCNRILRCRSWSRIVIQHQSARSSGVKWWTHNSSFVTIPNRKPLPSSWKVDDMIKANLRITIDGAAEELGIRHERSQKKQNSEFFLEGFLKLIKRYLRAFGDGPRHFEPWTERRLRYRQF
ncbi:hypothetical protein TNCV_1446111 [Trichonephila clavipes]|nr:hypothetical protein TNCV_1446111 [Trichonephila clavipes]